MQGQILTLKLKLAHTKIVWNIFGACARGGCLIWFFKAKKELKGKYVFANFLENIDF